MSAEEEPAGGESFRDEVTRIADADSVRGISSTPPPRTLPMGDRIAGRYIVRELKGVGGFGEVYAVDDEQLPGVPLALKIHRVGHLGRRAVDALKAEFAVLASLSHPNLVRVHDFGYMDEAYAYLTQELVDGHLLHHSGVELASRDGVDYIAQLLRALDYLHGRGLVHGDVKPGNLIIDENNKRLVLLDFGVTRALGDTSSELWGSPSYMAPELIRGLPVDGRADLYSLGVTIHRMVSGEFPFPGRTAREIFLAHLEKDPPRLHAPRGYADWVRGLLARDRRARPRTARHALQALSAATRRTIELDTDLTIASHIESAPTVGMESLIDSLVSDSARPGITTGIIEGSAGTGKTRAKEELRQRLQLAGGRWVSLRASRERSAGLVSQLAHAVLGRAEIAALSKQDRRDLAREFPALRQGRERIPAAIDLEQAAAHRRTILGRLLAASRRGRPGAFVIALQDAHWAKTGEQDELVEVLEAARDANARLMVLVTSRPGGVSPAWKALQPRVHTLRVLDAEGASSLVEAILGDLEPVEGTAFGETLMKGSCSPSWVRESLRWMLDEGRLIRSEGRFVRGGELPSLSFDDVLSRRIANLSRDARTVAAGIAVGGDHIHVGELQRLISRSQDRTAAGLQELLAHGVIARMVRLKGRSIHRLPDRYLDPVLEQVPARTLKAIRRRAARRAERNARGADAFIIAAQLYAQAGETERVERVMRRGLERALEDGRPDLGLKIFDRARALGVQFAGSDWLREHDMAIRVGDRARAESTLFHAEHDPGAPKVEAAIRRAGAERAQGLLGAAKDRLRLLLRHAEGALRAEVLVNLGEVHFTMSRAERAIERFDEAAEFSRGLDLRAIEARALLGKTLAQHALRDPAAELTARAAAAAARRARDLVVLSEAHRHLGSVALAQGKRARAATSYRSAMKAARDAGCVESEAKAVHNLGTVAHELGRVQDAIVAWHRAIELKGRAGQEASALLSRVCLAALLKTMGEFEEAKVLCSRIQSSPAVGAVLPLALAHGVRGEIALVHGDLSRAKREYAECDLGLDRRGQVHLRGPAVHALGRLALHTGELKDAKEYAAKSESIAGQTGSVADVRRMHLLHALIHWQEGDLGSAAADASKASRSRGEGTIYAEVFATRVEALFVRALISQDEEPRASWLLRSRELLQTQATRLGQRRERFLRSNPLFLAVVTGTLDPPPGCSFVL